MSGHPPTQRPDPFVRFRHGSIECTVVSDGVLQMGPARVNFPTADPDQVDALLTEHYLPTENVQLNENVLIADIAGRLVQFDSGVGIDPELGRGFFGPETGQLIPHMRAAGIDPADIDIVAVTHTHPDHVWGLVDAAGVPLYPNATIAVSREDFDYWTDLSHLGEAPNQHMRDHFLGAHKNLLPYAEAGRIMWVADGTQVVEGLTAVATPGHSPGHLIYRIDSDGETLIIWGDLCHHQVLLLQRPEWAFQFDYEKGGRNRAAVAGLRDGPFGAQLSVGLPLPFPGLGHLKKDGNAYAWLPMELPRRSVHADGTSRVTDPAVAAGAR